MALSHARIMQYFTIFTQLKAGSCYTRLFLHTHMHTQYNRLPLAHFEQCLQVHLAEVHPGDLPPIHIDLSFETHCLSY